MIGVLRIAAPLVGNADTAGKAGLAIDHQQLAVRPVIKTGNVVPVQRPVLQDFDAGLAHFIDLGIFHLAAAHPVQQHMHPHPGTGALGQRFGKLAADVAGPVNVGFEEDGVLC